MGNIEKARKLLKIGHILNPRDPVLLQSLGLLEYKHSTANVSRVLFRKASELDPKHQPVWIVRFLFPRIKLMQQILFSLYLVADKCFSYLAIPLTNH